MSFVHLPKILVLCEEKMRKISKFDRFRENSEIYILSAGNREYNIKIRYNILDIKVFVKEEFPLKMEIIRDEVFPVLGVAIPEFKRIEFTLIQYLRILLTHIVNGL